jgi:hypothetical protein
MRARILSAVLLCLPVAAVPLTAQTTTCDPEVSPDISILFPAAVEGLNAQFYQTMSGATTKLYKGGSPWAVVTIEPNQDLFLGTTADGLVDHYETSGADYVRFEEWPVTMVDQGELGESFITLRGAVRITVLVKEGDGGEATRNLARTFFREIFKLVPCDVGTY